MRWFVICFFLFGFSRIHSEYDTKEKIETEFSNVEKNLQGQEFRVINATPTLVDLKDGEIVIVSSNTFNKLMFRQNQEIYAIDVSCVTIIR